jgi:molybdenum cofactor cytidylyltransferase
LRLYHALRVQRGDIIALVGGGGKTSTMFRLGTELAGESWRVVMTTTTHIGADQASAAPHAAILPHQGATNLDPTLFTSSPILLTGPINPQTNKATGLDPNVVDQMISALKADVVLNEADGARLLPFKAPAEHEPAISRGTALVVPTVGIDVVGQPLDAEHVHRPERVAALSSAVPGQPVTLQTVAAVLSHPQGGLKNVPAQARVVVLINKVRSAAQREMAEQLAARLLDCPRIEAVAVGAVQQPDPIHVVRNRVAAVVLAAGEARRYGRLKQLQPWGGGSLLTHAVDTALASRAEPVIVVLGHRAEECRAALGQRPVRVVVNPDWAQGQSSSMQAGLGTLPGNIGGVVFHLADQPGVTPAVIDALIARYAATLAPVVWPQYQGRRGNPVLFDRVAFAALQQVSGDVGGKPVLQAYAEAGLAEPVSVDEPGVLMDIDRPEDLRDI